MLELIKKREKSNLITNKDSAIRDYILHNYYDNYFDIMSSKELDLEFRNDIGILVKALKKLPPNEQKAMVSVLTDVVEFYVGSKIEKELEKTMNNLFNAI